MIREILDALRGCLTTFVVCAIGYPAVVYGLGHTLFPRQAEGSLIEREGGVVGSTLIAQPFASDRYYHPRPSAAGASGYSADAASGSNLGSNNPVLRDRIADAAAILIADKTGDADLKLNLERLGAIQAERKALQEVKEPTSADAIARLDGEMTAARAQVLARSAELGKSAAALVPVDLVTASDAGLNPEISPEAALYQANRVAEARKIPTVRVIASIESHTERSARLIGAPPRVNVLRLNLALDGVETSR